MSFIKILLCSFISVLLLQNCTNNAAIAESEFDAEVWKNDKNACQNKRKALMGQFENIKARLNGLSEAELRKILGSPDNIELYRKHQKFYIYYIEPAEKCGNNNNKAERIHIRLNAINNVNEITQKKS